MQDAATPSPRPSRLRPLLELLGFVVTMLAALRDLLPPKESWLRESKSTDDEAAASDEL